MGILADSQRMCNEITCADCEIKKKANQKGISCPIFIMSYENEATELIEKWAKEHTTLIPEGIKTTLKMLCNLGYKTISINLLKEISCRMNENVTSKITMFPIEINSALTILKTNQVYRISDLIEFNYIGDIKPVTLEDYRVKSNCSSSVLTRDMIKDGMFVCVEDDDWGVVVGDKIIYRISGCDILSLSEEDGLVLDQITKVVQSIGGFDAAVEFGKVIYERKD